MKIDLHDITFLMLIRLDSIERLENIIVVTNQLCQYFTTTIRVLEVDKYCNKILKSVLNRKIQYDFIEDKDPVLYKTKYFNMMTKDVNTPYMALWDVDIIVDKNALIKCINNLRNNNVDVIYPYNGLCYNVSPLLRGVYLKRKDNRFLYRNTSKMDLLYEKKLVGGAILMKKKAYLEIGMENEIYYGWGNDDFDRYQRFIKFNYCISHLNIALFHLDHPRGNNSRYRSNFHKELSTYSYYKTAIE